MAALAAAAEDAVSEAACSALWTEQQHSWLQAMGYTLYLHGSALHAPEAEAEPAPPPAQARAPAAARPAAPAPGPRRTAPPVPAEMAPAPTTVTASVSASPPSPRASALRLPDRLQMALLRASGCDPNAPETRALMESWPLAELRRNPAAKRALWPQLRALRRKPRP